jgi:predicted Rossmann-fold nucleotide-binding protein
MPLSPCLNIARFYDPLFIFLRSLVEQRFLQRDHFDALLLESDMHALLAHLRAYQHVALDKWIDRPAPALNS